MGRQERKRWADNDKARELIEIAQTRTLTCEEIKQLRVCYTGYGGLSSWNTTQHFTPPVVVQFIYDCLNIPTGSKIFEASCGAGAFIQQAPVGCDVFGIELMQETANVARICNPDAVIETGDALGYLDRIEGKFDYAVGNPPFAGFSKKNAPEGYEVAPFSNRLEWYFVELSYRALKPGGMLALVVPDGVLSNARDQKCREFYIKNAWYRSTVSLPDVTFKHSGTGCKTSIIFIQKPCPSVVLPEEDKSVMMCLCENIGWDSRRREIKTNDLPKILDAMKNFPLDLVRSSKQAQPNERAEHQPSVARQPVPELKIDSSNQLTLF